MGNDTSKNIELDPNEIKKFKPKDEVVPFREG